MGRKSTYKKENDEQAAFLAKLGAIDKDLAEFFKVSEVTINTWKNKHPSFLEALTAGKLSANAQVKKALFQRALGYSHPETKFFCYEGVILSEETTKHYPPEVAACIFWLCNREPDNWRRTPDANNDLPSPPLSLTFEVKPAVSDISTTNAVP